MENAEIKIVVNGRSYSLRASNHEAFQYISEPDRIELLALLEAIKAKSEGVEETPLEAKSKRGDQQVSKQSSPAAASKPTSATLSETTPSPSSLLKQQAATALGDDPVSHAANPTKPGKGDIEDIMAKLILEEKGRQPTGLTKGSIYKFVGISLVLIVILVLIF